MLRAALGGVGVTVLVFTACLVEIRDPVPISGGGSGGTGAQGGANEVGGGTVSAGGTGGTGSVGGGSPCPEDMVHATDGGNISFCVDVYEVTQADYVQFLAAVGNSIPVEEQHPDCAFNTELTWTPDGSCDFEPGSLKPAHCVDWCDARAYCDWAGKRLCRGLDGNAMAFDSAPTVGEWHFACTGGLMKIYPYGNEADPAACNIPDTSARAEVGSFPDCEGGFPGIFDMQGNVAEYIDACDPGETGMCSLRGGHTFGTAAYWRCDNTDTVAARNDPDFREHGFRCCRDAN